MRPLEQVPPGPVPGLDGQRGLALFETQGLGLKDHRDLHRLTPAPSRRKGALGHHLALVPLGKGDLDLSQAAGLVSGFNRQAGFGAHHLHRGFQRYRGVVKVQAPHRQPYQDGDDHQTRRAPDDVSELSSPTRFQHLAHGCIVSIPSAASKAGEVCRLRPEAGFRLIILGATVGHSPRKTAVIMVHRRPPMPAQTAMSCSEIGLSEISSLRLFPSGVALAFRPRRIYL